MKDKVSKAMIQTTHFISRNVPDSTASVYQLAISFYALTLVNDPAKEKLLQALESKALEKDGMKYWILPDNEVGKLQSWRSWRPPKTRVRSLDVEATSYVLLGYNLLGETENGIKVYKWLGRQRNPTGGFISTQDTVIALQALAGLGEKIHDPDSKITVYAKGDTWPGKAFTVDNNNSLVLQTVDLPKTVRQVSVTTNGSGLCIVEVSVFYNVYSELRKPAFRLTPSVLNDSTKGFRLRVCFSWTRKGQSTMGYMEITLPSGMDADIDSLDKSKTRDLFEKAEKDARQIKLFFREVTKREMCIELKIYRTGLVARNKPVPIKLREYYEPSNEVIEMYQSKALADSTITDVCGEDGCN